MKKRWIYEQHEETTFIISDSTDTEPGLIRRILGFVGKTILVLFATAVPAYFIYRGIDGLVHGQIHLGGRKFGTRLLTGTEALFWSWTHIAFGVGAPLYVFNDNLPSTAKWLLWICIAGCAGAAIYCVARSGH